MGLIKSTMEKKEQVPFWLHPTAIELSLPIMWFN